MSTVNFCLSRKMLLSLLFAVLCLPVVGLADLAGSGQSEEQSFEFKNASLKSVLKILGKQLSVEIFYDNSVKDLTLTIERKNITMKEMIRLILEKENLQARATGRNQVTIFPDTEEHRLRYESFAVWPQ